MVWCCCPKGKRKQQVLKCWNKCHEEAGDTVVLTTVVPA